MPVAVTARVLALALTALASEAGAQYPFVPPPTPCVPITGLRLTGELIPIARSSAPPRTLGIAPFGHAGSTAVRFALLAPGFDGLRSDPRFRRLVEASSSSGGER